MTVGWYVVRKGAELQKHRMMGNTMIGLGLRRLLRFTIESTHYATRFLSLTTRSQAENSKEPKLLTASELGGEAGCHLQIAGPSSVAITPDVYRTVKQAGIRAQHQRFGPLSGQSEVLTTSTSER